MTLKRVVIESPLRGDRELNKLYARVCALDCLVRGESPYASHLFFDHEDLLDDTIEEQRELGIKAGFAWGAQAELRVFYKDLGESDGMKRGLVEALMCEQLVEDRWLFSQIDSSPNAIFMDLGKLSQQALLRERQQYFQMKLGRPFERIDQ